jgi:hypothetical protein
VTARAWRFALAAALVGASAAAEPSRRPPVELEVDPCTGVAPDVVSRILTVELGVGVTMVSPGEASDPSQKPDTTQIALSCEDGTIKMVVRDPLTGKTLERHIDLRAERSSARPRLLSLSAAELVAASWIELDHAPPPPAPIVEATAAAPARAEGADVARAAFKRQEPVQWDVEALALARHFPDADLTTWGGGVAATWAYHGWLALGADIAGETGSAAISHQRVAVGSAAVRTGSVALAARLRRAWPTLALEAGVGARIALTRLRATTEETLPGVWQEHAFVGAWGGPLAQVRVGWTPSPFVLLFGMVEAGTVTRPLVGLVAKQPEVVLDGPWASISLGIGIGNGGRGFAR